MSTRITKILGLTAVALSTWLEAQARVDTGHAVSFDGTVNAVVMVPNVQTFSGSALTVEFWARSAMTARAGSLFSYAVNGNANAFLVYDHRNLTIWIGAQSIATGVSISDGQWHHVAVTWENSGELKIFKDGALAYANTFAAGATIPSGGFVVLGQDQDFVGGGFDGQQAFLGEMDEVRVWRGVRSEQQIQEDMGRFVSRFSPDLGFYLRFEEGTGTELANGVPGVPTGILLSGVDWIPHKPYNAGLALDLNNRFAQVPHDARQNSLPLTISAWIRTSSSQPTDVIASKVDMTQGVPIGYELLLQNGSLTGYYMLGYDYRVDFRAFGTDYIPVNDGKWHHVAMTITEFGGFLYVDGSPVATRAWTVMPVKAEPATPLLIGHPGANGFPGEIDELSLWGTGLDEIFAAELMSMRLRGNEPGLIALYHFDEGGGPSVLDATAHQFHATVEAGQWPVSGARVMGFAELGGLVTDGAGPSAETLVRALRKPIGTSPMVPVPDNGFVVSELPVEVPGVLGDLRVQVNIKHAFRGDLELTLIHPDGTEVRLRNADASDDLVDLKAAYSGRPAGVPELAVLYGKPIAGIWKLRARDAFINDTGTLNSWSIEVGPQPVITDGSGVYRFDSLFAGEYSLLPERAGFTFVPPFRSALTDSMNADFAVSSGFISGRVRDGAAGLAGARVSTGDASTFTDSSGAYILNGLSPGSKTVSVSRPGYTFAPPALTANLGSGNADFAVAGYPVAGRVIDVKSNGFPSVTITASTGGSAGMTDAQGHFLIAGVPPGAFTIAPQRPGVVFSPASLAAQVGPALSNVLFLATASPPTITAIADQVTPLNGSTDALRFDVQDAETTAARLQVQGTSDNTRVVPNGNIVIEGVGSARTVRVTPATNQLGSALITLRVTDDSGLSATEQFTVRVNNAPVVGGGFALRFNGVDQFASGPAGVMPGKGNFALEVWASAPTLNGARTIVSQGAGFSLGVDASGTIRVGTDWNTGVRFPTNGWQHIALVREASDTHLYLNGSLAASRGSALPYAPQDAVIEIGRRGAAEYWAGDIDEVRVWSIARSASEVAGYARARVIPNEPGLAALWRFDEAGQLATDITPAQLKLSVSGATRVNSSLRFMPYILPVTRTFTDVLPAFDADGDRLVFSLISSPVRGSVSLIQTTNGVAGTTNGLFTYTANGLGQDQFAFSVHDGFTNSEVSVINLSIYADTNAPAITFIPDQVIQEDTVAGPINFTVGDAESQAEWLTVFPGSDNVTLLPPGSMEVTGSGAQRMLTIRPATNAFGTALVTLTVSDSGRQQRSSFRLSVLPVNDAPIVHGISNLVVSRSRGANARVVITDPDDSSDLLNVQASAVGPANATIYHCPILGPAVFCIAIGSSGSQSGPSTVTVFASDANSTSSNSFQVLVNDAPLLAPIPTLSTFSGMPSAPITVRVTDVDSDLGQVILSAASSDDSLVEPGGFSFSGSGTNRSLVITPVPGRVGKVQITVFARDEYQTDSTSFDLFIEEGPVFEYVRLPFLPNRSASWPTAINDRGQVAGGMAVESMREVRSVVWDYSGPEATVSLLPGLENIESFAKAINNKGEVLGNRSWPVYDSYLYKNGSISVVHTNPGALAMNESGAMLFSTFANTIRYTNGPFSQFIQSGQLYGGADLSYQPAVGLNALGNVAVGGDRSLYVWRLEGGGNAPLTLSRQTYDLGFTTEILALWPRGMNSSGDIAGFIQVWDIPFIYRTRSQQFETNFLPMMAAQGYLGTRGFGWFNGINDAGEAVGEGILTNGSYDGFLYTEGRLIRFRDLIPRSVNYGSSIGRAINSNGDIVGYLNNGFNNFESYSQAFVLKRKRWVVGQGITAPLQAIDPGTKKVFRPPIFEATDGTPATEAAQATLWSAFEQKFYFLRPISGRISWATSADLFNTNNVERVGGASWPERPQLHVATAPVNTLPLTEASPYRPIRLVYSTAPNAALDPSSKTFVTTGPGYSVIHYLIAPGTPLNSLPDSQTHSNYFEVVRTYAWNDPAVRTNTMPAEIGAKVTDPRGPAIFTNSVKSGWVINAISPYDGAGPDAAYNRATQTGPIIPVNRDSSDPGDDLVVAFYKLNPVTRASWADLAVPYSINWPTSAPKLVIANPAGSGMLPDAEFPNKRIYNQPDPRLPGYNPNEEHALLAPSSSGEGVFALRNDLNRPDTSRNFVLLKYRDPSSGEWRIKTYEVVLNDANHNFEYAAIAGQEILPPYPLGIFPVCEETRSTAGQAFRDYKGKFYAAGGPIPGNLSPRVQMRYAYPLQPGFFWEGGASLGSCVPWRGIHEGESLAREIEATFSVNWPADAPSLQIGETLLDQKRGLPDIKDWASAQVVFDSRNPEGQTPLASAVRLYDPLSPRTVVFTNVGVAASYRLPAEIKLINTGDKQVFADLPFHLRSRLSFDPRLNAITFSGFLTNQGVGEPLLLVNVMTTRELERIQQLSTDTNFRYVVQKLYELTRNPNRVNTTNPGQEPPDLDLLIGFTTRFSVRTNNTVVYYYGRRPAGEVIKAEIVQEPLGSAPKALTAGLPVGWRTADFGNALQLDGVDDLITTPEKTAAPTQFSLSLWFKTDSTKDTFLASFCNTQSGLFSRADRILRLTAGGRVEFQMLSISAAVNVVSTGTNYNDNRWHHVLATYSTATGLKLYVDGNLAGTKELTAPLAFEGYWRFGSGLLSSYAGMLDDIRVYDTVLAEDQVAQVRARPAAGTEPGLRHYWRLDESTGNIARNSARPSANATLLGGPARVQSVPATAGEASYIVLAENNNPELGALPVSLKVIRVDGGPFRGDLKLIYPDNVFDERLTLRHSSDFGGDPGRLEFEWWYHPDSADFDPTQLPVTAADGTVTDPRGWILYSPALVPDKFGQNSITLGDGAESSQFTLSDNWFICRYKGYEIADQKPWSAWIGDPASAGQTRAMLAVGWIKRVLEGINPFEDRTKRFHETPASTYASMLIQAGQRYEGDVALSPSPENLNSMGLIELYTTVLNRGRQLSIDGTPPVDSDPLNNALLLAGSRIAEFYTLLGNEAFADAQDPTIGFFSDSLEFSTLATATFAFKNQLDSLLEEELTLLRGRDDSGAGVGARPVYNRLLWNFTGSDGEIAYERTYNVGDVNLDGVINEFDARILFPQGHGDAWGHYLTASKTYYDLLRHPRFTWVPRTESVLIAGTSVRVDFLDERKFAAIAAAKAKTGSEIVDLTYRARYVDDPEGQYQGYKDTNPHRAWGVTEWARRAGQSAYFDWLTANAVLPSTDPNPNHVGLQRIDRQTVKELDQIASEHSFVQAQLDKSDVGLNPLGLAKGAVPFDIDPNLVVPTLGVPSSGHFEQIYERAVRSLNNCVTVWNQANELSEALRRQQDDVDDFTGNVADQERDFKSRLIEVFGYPYSGDIGPGKTYPSGYDGPDLYHFMYLDAVELTGKGLNPGNVLNGYFAPFASGDVTNFYFGDDFTTDSFSTQPFLNVRFPLAREGWAFTAPRDFGARRAPGELQLALSDLVQEETRLKIALGNYDAIIKQIRESAILLQSRSALSNRTIQLIIGQNQTITNINNRIETLQDAQLGLRRVASISSRLTGIIADFVPEDPADFVFPVDELAGQIYLGASIAAEVMETIADVLEGQQNRQERAKEETELQRDLDIEIASQDYEIKQQAAELLALFREEGTLRLETFNQAELVKQAFGRYQATLAAGMRLMDERTVFRQRTAAATQQNRYKDIAFRIFRNEALQKYRAQFDLAARYTYLAAAAYDYDLNFLGSDNRSGRDFFTDLVRQRTIGQLIDGIPIAGSSGLADPLGRLMQNYEVLKPRFGLNNPQTETSRISLRKEHFRVRDASDSQWRAILRQSIVENLWEVPEFRRYCRPFAPESAGPQPGIVLRFPTTVTFGLNLFGHQLGPDDNAYDPSLFSTKVGAVGVWFENYKNAGLSTAPRVYLVPAGMDILRSPTGNTLATREFRVVDQVIPVPFPIGASDLENPAWIPANDSLAEMRGQIRRFSSFRAYHDNGLYEESEIIRNSRLIGRSVWNTDWMLIIPGGTFLYDPEQGLEQFVNSVTDIRLSLESYSYPGD